MIDATWQSAGGRNARIASAPRAWSPSSPRSTTSPSRGPARNALAALAAILLLAGPVSAQRLNLQSTSAPPAGSGAAALALADSLNQQAQDLRSRAASSPAAAVSMALRTTARDLLLAGEAAGEPGSSKILLARTIANHLAAFDARAGDAARLDAATLSTIARDLEALRPGQDLADLERGLRDALAPMTQTAEAITGPAGWFEPGQAPAAGDEPLVRWAAALEITDPLRDAITHLDERLRAAQSWTAYGPAARRAAALVRAAAGPIERRPGWLTVQASRDLEDRLVEAIAPLAGTGPAADPRDPAARLRRVAQLARLLEQAARLDDSATAARELRAGLMDLLKAADPTPGEDRRLAALERALSLAERRRELERDTDIVRQLRPGLRALVPAARESEAAMLSAARRLLTADDAASDPAVLNAISGHQRRVDDLALVADLNAVIATTGPSIPGERPVPAVAPEFHGLADWVFQVGQDLTKPGRRDLAVAELREVAGGAVDVLRSPSLDRLRAAVDPSRARIPGPSLQDWQDLTGDRAAALTDAADKARAGLTAAWSAKDVPRRREVERRARQIARVVAALDDAAWSRSLAQAQQSGLAIAGMANLQQWPGWELSPAALSALSDGLTSATRAAVDRLLAGSDGETESAVRGLEAKFGAVLLAGRLQRRASEAGLRSARPGPGPALLEIGLGPPDPHRSWMIAERQSLAAIGRYAEEWAAAARDPRQDDRARSIRAYLDSLAARTLDRLRVEE